MSPVLHLEGQKNSFDKPTGKQILGLTDFLQEQSASSIPITELKDC